MQTEFIHFGPVRRSTLQFSVNNHIKASVLTCCNASVAAAKQNSSTKDCTKKDVEEVLQIWFANVWDRSAGGRKHT